VFKILQWVLPISAIVGIVFSILKYPVFLLSAALNEDGSKELAALISEYMSTPSISPKFAANGVELV